MNEYEKIFCENLYGSIKRKVKGKLSVIIENDILVISNSKDGMEVTVRQDDMAEKICSGCTASYISYQFIQWYKKEVLKTYFK